MFKFKAPKAIERKGHQASDLMSALTDPMEASLQNPRTDKPIALVETARFPNGNELEAKDHALYEMLYAYARLHGIDREEHEISANVMQKYLGVSDLSRIVSSIDRIRSARIAYDFVDPEREVRRKGEMPLILAETTTHLKTGASSLIYSIPPAVRRYVAASQHWTWLEITAFPQFKSKYTSPLYQRLSLVGGPYKVKPEVWSVAPEQLADIVGYRPKNGKFSFGIFNRDVLQPALSDIEQHITRFRVSADIPRGAGKGRRVNEIAFTVVAANNKPLSEIQASRLSPAGMRTARQPDVHGHHERPSTLLIGQAVTATGWDDVDIVEAWKAALDRAKADPAAQVVDGMQGGLLLYTLQEFGVGKAFQLWLECVHGSDQKLVTERAVRQASSRPAYQVEYPAVEEVIEEAINMEIPDDTTAEIDEVVPVDPEYAAKLERHKGYAQDEAASMLKKLDNRCPFTDAKRTWDDAHFLVYCDAEISPWNSLVSHMSETDTRNLENTVGILRLSNARTIRSTLRNLSAAIMAWDLEKIEQVSKAVYASYKSGTMLRGDIKSKSGARTNNFTPTRQVTESASEYDFADPAYAAAVSWNDIDLPDAEGADKSA